MSRRVNQKNSPQLFTTSNIDARSGSFDEVSVIASFSSPSVLLHLHLCLRVHVPVYVRVTTYVFFYRIFGLLSMKQAAERQREEEARIRIRLVEEAEERRKAVRANTPYDVSHPHRSLWQVLVVDL